MGKRKNKDQEYLKKKIRKLERKLKRIPTQEESADSSPPFSPTPMPRSPSPPLMPTPLTPTTGPLKPPSPTPLHQPAGPVQNNQDLEEFTTDDVLPEEFLLALGTEGEETTVVGEAIRPELALRWTKIMSAGLGRESMENLIKKYPTASNFPRSVAPKINPEISASLSEQSLKRDKRICNRQNLTGRILTCLGKSLTKIMKGNINSKILIEEVNDAAKLAAELYHQDSSSRKFFALAGTNKMIQDAVRTTAPDEYLFGADCADKIRAAQAVQKTGSQIKITEKMPSRTHIGEKKLNNPRAPVKKQGNWRGPSQNQQHRRARVGQQQHPYQHRQPRFEQPPRQTVRQTQNRPRSRYHH